jgi:hypothetical protein
MFPTPCSTVPDLGLVYTLGYRRDISPDAGVLASMGKRANVKSAIACLPCLSISPSFWLSRHVLRNNDELWLAESRVGKTAQVITKGSAAKAYAGP